MATPKKITTGVNTAINTALAAGDAFAYSKLIKENEGATLAMPDEETMLLKARRRYTPGSRERNKLSARGSAFLPDRIPTVVRPPVAKKAPIDLKTENEKLRQRYNAGEIDAGEWEAASRTLFYQNPPPATKKRSKRKVPGRAASRETVTDEAASRTKAYADQKKVGISNPNPALLKGVYI